MFRRILSDIGGLGERTARRKVNGEDRMATYAAAGKLPAMVEAFEKAKKASSKAEIVALINDCDLPRQAIPTQWLNEVEVWDALLQRMPLTALVRSLGKMTAVGLVKPFSAAANLVIRKLGDEALLKRARIRFGGSGLPVFDLQGEDASEFCRIVRHQGQVVRLGDSGNHQVVRADDVAGQLKFMPDVGVSRCRSVVKGERGVRGKGFGKDSQAAFAIAIFLRAVEQLGFDDRAEEDVRRCKPFEAGADRRFG